ncbi:hypothetical protein BJX63DRAFT_427663 [Aspergillus granulosus]|uniref:DUF8212 domain-containing protein n=1 Tax=Aspergillus granulosus TaxID=176169 RepID=A0ABR4I1P3_9EURO
MFRWYEDAEVCYAYLADVPHGAVTGDEFRKGKWFTRGWTLQELIAPSSLIFLDSEWKRIDEKSGLQKSITEITGIPGNFLLGDELGYASVAQRMSWAAKRKTKRKEDIAYCLMGIFGVHMPMLYGEGERAFIRLQEEIMRVTNDHSLFAWKSAENHGGILATSPAAFADSGNIIRTSPSDVMGDPFTPSSRGIRLSLRFGNDEQRGSGLAILDCTRIGKENKRLVIHLKDVFRTKQDFTREGGSELELLDLGDINTSQYPRKDLYVRHWRSTRNRKRGNTEKCAISFKGLGKKEVALSTVYLDSNLKIYDELIVTTVDLPTDGIIGRLLIIYNDGNSFQLVLMRYQGLLLVDIDNSLEVNTQLSQNPERQQYRQEQIIIERQNGQSISAAIAKRIFLLHDKKHLVDLVEIEQPANCCRLAFDTWLY